MTLPPPPPPSVAQKKPPAFRPNTNSQRKRGLPKLSSRSKIEVSQDNKKLDELSPPTAPQKAFEKSWLRQHWCIFVYITLAFFGIFLPLYVNYIHSCDERVNLAPVVTYEDVSYTVTNVTVTQVVTETKQPVDLQMIMDASGSMTDEDWTNSLLAAQEWVKTFHAQIPSLQVGISQFASSASDTFILGDAQTALDMLPTLPRVEVGATDFKQPLKLFENSLSQNRQNGSLPICVLISDGQPTTRNYMNVVQRLKEAGVIFVGVLVMPFVFNEAQEAMFEVATCDGYAMSTCPNYVLAQNFQELKDEANQLASEVASEVETNLEVQNVTTVRNETAIKSVENLSYVEQKSCDPGLWWLTNLLILPLLILLFLQFCRGKKKQKKVKRTRKIKPVADVEAPPMKPETPTEQPELKTRKVKKSKYKWDVPATDHYLWNFSGGATPMRVDYGSKAPPSAPKDLRLGKVKRACENWEEGEEYYEYEVVEEEQTLEEWAEEILDKATKSSNWCCLCCCCCKCCRKEITNQDTAV